MQKHPYTIHKEEKYSNIKWSQAPFKLFPSNQSCKTAYIGKRKKGIKKIDVDFFGNKEWSEMLSLKMNEIYAVEMRVGRGMFGKI